MSHGLHPWGAGKHGYLLKCCPVTLLNDDALFTTAHPSQEAVWVEDLNSMHTAQEGAATFSGNQKSKYFSACSLGFTFPEP